MISKKVFYADGVNARFLSDFIILSEQFARVYAYIYDDTLNPDGTEDKLQDGTTDPANWVYPTNLWKRGNDAPKSIDLLTIEKWDLVTNSVLLYKVPLAPTKIWIEVATTPEEFGDTLIQPTVVQAEAAAADALTARIAAQAAQAAAEVAKAGTDANVLLTNADVVSTHADVVLTGLDVAATHADVVLTHADVVATHVDVTLTHADVVLTHTDVTLTGIDLAATTANVLLTNADVVSTHADVLLTNADVILTHADVALTNADVVSAQLFAWEAEAERLTADSYATQLEDVFVNLYTSDGDGTFTATPTADYSALHWNAKAAGHLPTPTFPADEGLALVTRATGNAWEKILGLPLETGNKGKSVTNHGVEGDSFWSPVTTNPNSLTANYTLDTDTSASVVSGFTIVDGVTLTIPDGSVFSVV